MNHILKAVEIYKQFDLKVKLAMVNSTKAKLKSIKFQVSKSQTIIQNDKLLSTEVDMSKKE
jgi:hypothetical protein